MSRALLVFDLPDEADLFDNASHATQWRSVVEELDQYLRDRLKYGELPKRVRDEMQTARNELFAMLRDRGLRVE
jgi:hypothetical protein